MNKIKQYHQYLTQMLEMELLNYKKERDAYSRCEIEGCLTTLQNALREYSSMFEVELR